MQTISRKLQYFKEVQKMKKVKPKTKSKSTKIKTSKKSASGDYKSPCYGVFTGSQDASFVGHCSG